MVTRAERSNARRVNLDRGVRGAQVLEPLCFCMDKFPSANSKIVVLVVEDEFLVRMDAANMIREAGFDVVEVNNADDAIAILEQRKDIRIVFTDIDIPGSMDGLKLAHAIRDRWPPIELILTSGQSRLSRDQLPARGHFIPKPYSSDAVVAAIQRFAL
jgi:CheY-like chemotaxis protein